MCMGDFGKVEKGIVQSIKQTEKNFNTFGMHLVISVLTGFTVLLQCLSDRCLSDNPPPTLCSVLVCSDRKQTPIWIESPRLPLPCQHVYLHCFLWSLPFLPFCDSCVFSRVAELNPVDFCDECAALFCWTWTWSAQRKAPVYLFNEKYELCLRALSICLIRYCIDALWQLSEKTYQELDVAEVRRLWTISTTSNTSFSQDVSFPHQKKNRLMQQRCVCICSFCMEKMGQSVAWSNSCLFCSHLSASR